MPVTFVGDVHGWSDRLESVLAQAVGEVVLLGDLVDRGPDAAGVLRHAHRICTSGTARCLMGNHEFALVRALGCSERDLPPEPDFAPIWRSRYGAEAVYRSFAVRDDDGLRAALGPLLTWIADLPWVLEGRLEDGRTWVAVHAGLDPDQAYAAQLTRLRAGWAQRDANLPRLFDKLRVKELPWDFPADHVLISGHTPLPKPWITPRRILCDTSGGMPGRALTAVVLPGGAVVQAV